MISRPPPDQDQQDRAEMLQWIERVSTFCVEEWALSPITGRILGLLMICDPPERSTGQIAETIQASRASMTSNLRFLTTIGLIRKVRVPGDRITYYRIEDDAWHKVIQRKLESLATFADIADRGIKIAGQGPSSERIRAAQQALAWLTDLTARNTNG